MPLSTFSVDGRLCDPPTDCDDIAIMKLTLRQEDDGQPNPYNSVIHEQNAFHVPPATVVSSAPLSSPPSLAAVGQQQHPGASAPPANATLAPPNAAIGGSVKLLSEFEERCKYGEWPTSTCVHCYWCCSAFEGRPVGLPVRYRAGKYHVVGCFCSLSCAAAYNFEQSGRNISVDESLSRYGLLNALSRSLGGGTTPVRPAPDRLALGMFGGHLSIDEFREASSTSTRCIVNNPPMQSLTQHVEDTGLDELRSEYRFIPLDNERISKYQEKIRLSRTKPLTNPKNTLDHSMNLKVSRTRPAAAGG